MPLRERDVLTMDQPAAAMTARICDHLRHGAGPRDAAEAAGMSPEEYERLLREDPGFAAALRRAQAECAVAMARRIEAVADREWRAAEAWLKHRRADWSDDKASGDGPNGLCLFRQVVFDDDPEAVDD